MGAALVIIVIFHMIALRLNQLKILKKKLKKMGMEKRYCSMKYISVLKPKMINTFLLKHLSTQVQDFKENVDPGELTGTNNNNMDQAANAMDEVCLDATVPQETPQDMQSSKENSEVDIRCGEVLYFSFSN